jgi:hypothetical protein
VVQDAPPALRKLNSNVFAFFKNAKANFSLLRRSRYEVEGGYVTIDDVPFIPVYLVPTKQQKWKALAALLTELVANFDDSEWLETVTNQFTIPPDFTAKWCAILESDVVVVEEEPSTKEDDEMFDFTEENEQKENEGVTTGGG